MLNIVKNEIRSLLNIRKERVLPPAGSMPAFGSTIVLHRLKIQLRMSLEPEQWDWLTLKGWRTQDMRKNRRKYFKVPGRAVARLLHATPEQREEIYQRIMTYAYDDSQLS